MKIIGKNNAGFIATLSEHEICLLMGFNSLYQQEWKDKRNALWNERDREVKFEGVEIDVCKFHEKVTAIRDNEKRSQGAIRTMRDLADALEKAWPSLELPNKEVL